MTWSLLSRALIVEYSSASPVWVVPRGITLRSLSRLLQMFGHLVYSRRLSKLVLAHPVAFTHHDHLKPIATFPTTLISLISKVAGICASFIVNVHLSMLISTPAGQREDGSNQNDRSLGVCLAKMPLFACGTLV